MLNSLRSSDRDEATERTAIAGIVAAGPVGALAVAGVATTIVVAGWLAFYLLVFVPRGSG